MATNEVQPVKTKIVLEAFQRGQKVETNIEIKGLNHQAIMATLNLVKEMMRLQTTEKGKRELADNINKVIDKNLYGDKK